MHLISDKEIKGIDERLDRLISLQLHYHEKLIVGGKIKCINTTTRQNMNLS